MAITGFIGRLFGALRPGDGIRADAIVAEDDGRVYKIPDLAVPTIVVILDTSAYTSSDDGTLAAFKQGTGWVNSVFQNANGVSWEWDGSVNGWKARIDLTPAEMARLKTIEADFIPGGWETSTTARISARSATAWTETRARANTDWATGSRLITQGAEQTGQNFLIETRERIDWDASPLRWRLLQDNPGAQEEDTPFPAADITDQGDNGMTGDDQRYYANLATDIRAGGFTLIVQEDQPTELDHVFIDASKVRNLPTGGGGGASGPVSHTERDNNAEVTVAEPTAQRAWTDWADVYSETAAAAGITDIFAYVPAEIQSQLTGQAWTDFMSGGGGDRQQAEARITVTRGASVTELVTFTPYIRSGTTGGAANNYFPDNSKTGIGLAFNRNLAVGDIVKVQVRWSAQLIGDVGNPPVRNAARLRVPANAARMHVTNHGVVGSAGQQGAMGQNSGVAGSVTNIWLWRRASATPPAPDGGARDNDGWITIPTGWHTSPDQATGQPTDTLYYSVTTDTVNAAGDHTIGVWTLPVIEADYNVQYSPVEFPTPSQIVTAFVDFTTTPWRRELRNGIWSPWRNMVVRQQWSQIMNYSWSILPTADRATEARLITLAHPIDLDQVNWMLIEVTVRARGASAAQFRVQKAIRPWDLQSTTSANQPTTWTSTRNILEFLRFTGADNREVRWGHSVGNPDVFGDAELRSAGFLMSFIGASRNNVTRAGLFRPASRGVEYSIRLAVM